MSILLQWVMSLCNNLSNITHNSLSTPSAVVVNLMTKKERCTRPGLSDVQRALWRKHGGRKSHPPATVFGGRGGAEKRTETLRLRCGTKERFLLFRLLSSPHGNFTSEGAFLSRVVKGVQSPMFRHLNYTLPFIASEHAVP